MKSKILFHANQVFENEIRSLIEVQKNLVSHEQFIYAVEAVTSCKGKIVVTGVGKSAIIGQKIVATFNSTGTPAIFLHASDALHGDLGIIQKDDVIIIISKSGDSDEIKNLMGSLSKMGNRTIAFVSNLKSNLAIHADINLYLHIEKEADPNNLAPTSSTTCQLVMGDALAMCVMIEKGFTAQDFAKFHPGGILGKSLLLTIGDIAKKHQAPYVSNDDSLSSVIYSISAGRLGATVVTSNHNILGIITDGDIRRMISQRTDFKDIIANDIMTKNPKCLDHSELVSIALEQMNELNITQIIVTKDNQFMGFVHIHDVLKEGLIL